jgi:hypothetical protein
LRNLVLLEHDLVLLTRPVVEVSSYDEQVSSQ